jgi:hypothetical protein
MEPTLHDRSNDDENAIVLVIDDDADVREGLRALLESVSLRSTPGLVRCRDLASRSDFSRTVKRLIELLPLKFRR